MRMIYVMGLALEDLDPRTRTFMVSELNTDLTGERLYVSPWLTPEGRRQWPDLLRIALHAHDATWLADTLEFNELLRELDPRAEADLAARVPPTAAKTLAEGQFHGYYVRGVCRRALEDGMKTVTVVRVGAPEDGTHEAQSLIDAVLNATELLEGLRGDPAIAPAARFLGGPSSGLSVRISRSAPPGEA